MRIAQVLHGWPASQMGGTGLYVQALSSALVGLGHELAVVFPAQTDGTASETKDGVLLKPLLTKPARRWRDTWDGSISPWTDWLEEWRPDVVHFHHLSGLPLSLVENTPCRTVLTLHDYAIPCARGQLVTEDLAACAGPSPSACTQCMSAALSGNPVTATAGRILSKFPGLYRLGRRSLKHRNTSPHPDITERLDAAQRCLRSADILLSPSHDLSSRLASMSLPAAQITELPLVQPVAPFPVPDPGPVRFLFASSIIPTKGPDRLYRAFESIKGDAQLTIAGHAPEYPSHPGYAATLKDKVDRHPRARWLGHIPADQVMEIMKQHDVLVLPSIWPENSPLVIREAAAGGLSIIASSDGGARELSPHATLIQTDDDLLAAMQAEVNQGRTRHPPMDWPEPTEHACTLLENAYVQK